MHKILIVDDEELVRKVLLKLITKKGYEVFAAETGREALEIAKKEHPSVVLVDLLLEDMPGLAVMREMKDILPASECIVVTGVPTKDSAIAAVNLGAFGFVTKPWDSDALMVMIKGAINQAETTEALIESEERYRQLAESAHDYIYMVDKNFVLQYVNEAGAKMFGRKPADMIGKNLQDLFAKETFERQKRSIEKVLSTGESLLIEDEYEFDGQKRKLSARLSPVRNEHGEITAIHGISRDLEGSL